MGHHCTLLISCSLALHSIETPGAYKTCMFYCTCVVRTPVLSHIPFADNFLRLLRLIVAFVPHHCVPPCFIFIANYAELRNDAADTHFRVEVLESSLDTVRVSMAMPAFKQLEGLVQSSRRALSLLFIVLSGVIIICNTHTLCCFAAAGLESPPTCGASSASIASPPLLALTFQWR